MPPPPALGLHTKWLKLPAEFPLTLAPTTTAYPLPGTTVILFLYAKAPPLPSKVPPALPPPIATAETEVTPVGAIHV
jgi:hypothetical protein